MALKKSDLYSSLWASRDELRGGMDASQYKDCVLFKLSWPSDSKEQEAIAAALSEMDVELFALEARRDKTRALEQGMMQELLTGRTRLVTPAGEDEHG